MEKRIVLKSGREKALLGRHPWIFSGSIDKFPKCAPGEVLPIFSSKGEFLAQGYFNPKTSISGRILVFHKGDVLEEIHQRIKAAYSLRKKLLSFSSTNAYRLINGEADGIPGLIVDVYDGYLAFQSHTCGIDRLRDKIVAFLIEVMDPKGIYEKSISSSRVEEGLAPVEKSLYKTIPSTITILENKLKFQISMISGQKTGFFLDQRNMRMKVAELSHGMNVLNCFAYSGAFGIYALHGGAKSVINIDSSKAACDLAHENAKENGFSKESFQAIATDAFEYLNSNALDFDLVILDPPAFVKKRRHLENAVKGYERLNTIALKKIPSGSLLLTCSCSTHVDEALFQKIIYLASKKAGRFVRILSKHILAPDHPISIHHPEGSYLKSLLLFVE